MRLAKSGCHLLQVPTAYVTTCCSTHTLRSSLNSKKESHNRPGVAQRVPGGLGSQISWHSACEGGEVVSLTHRPPLPPEMFLVLIFTRDWVDPRAMEGSEGNMSLKNPVTTPGNDPRTVRLVAQRLNHYATPGPLIKFNVNTFNVSLTLWIYCPDKICQVSIRLNR